jgi:surface protein
VNGEQVAFPLPACTDIVVNIVNQYRRVALSYAIDTTEDNILNARVEGDAVSVGTYALEVRGKIFGNDWRSKEYEQFAIVDNNASGDTAFNGELIEGEDSVEMNTALVILPPTAELTQLITDANTAIETAKQTDATLKANESERTEAEQQRASAEVARVSAENKRSESEGVRHAAEVERVSNEDARKATEVQRANAEVGRVEAERVRTANETARVAAEKQRATTFAELSVNIDAAVSKANSAASAANTATDKANAEEGKRAEAENLRADAEATRKQNENTRLGAETERVRQETAREAAESVRQTAEAERAGNESARKVSESDRVAAEQQRVSAETERMSNEDARKTAESERVNGETARQTAENEREADEQERKTNETERKTAETQRKKAEETRIAAEASRVSAEEQREATLATTKANCEAATKKASDAASEATLATSKANSSAEKANAAVVAAENVDATLANDVLTVTNRKGESTSLQLARYAEVGDVVSEVKHLSETMGAYTDRPDIVLTAKETNKAISASGAKVNKSGWAIAEFTAEKGNVYLFKPNVIDESVCIFAEYIQSVETRGIDYTYTYNSDGTTATATATYLGATHTYTYTYAEDKSFAITDETGAAVDALPMVYETKVGTYSPLVSLNADAELPKDGYCRYMSHFKGNSAIKVVVSYKVGVADLTMKVTRDGVLASVSTQLGNLSQMEDETRKKIDELHGNWVDVLFLADTTVYVDYKAVIIKGKTRTRLYPKQQLQFGGKQYGSFIPLLWADLSHLTSAIRLSYFKEGNAQGLFQGCNKISSLTLNNLGISKNVTLKRMFSGCSSLQSLNIEGWDVSKVTDMYGMFASCSSLQSLNIEGWDVSKVASMNQIFYGCSSLRSLDLSGWNLESCKNIDYLGQYNFIPKTLKLGTGFFKCPATKASLYFTTWTDASVKESLVVNSYDRKANGLPDFTLTLSKQTKAVLSEDDIAAMTAKGYIIA